MSTSINLPLLELREYQKNVWNYMLQDKPGLRAVTVWPRRNGKDLVAFNILVAKAVQQRGLYMYIAPFATQVRMIVWDGIDGTGTKFLDYIPSVLKTRVLDQQMKVWLTNGSIIQLVGSDNPSAIVGTNPRGLVFTEYSLHKDAIWSYMRPILAENGGWALFNGTPRGMNHLYQMAQMAQGHPDWFYEYLTCEDTGFPTLAAIEEDRRSGMPESLIQQEYYVSWAASSEETLIPLDSVLPCIDLPLAEAEYTFAPRIIGVDPAYAENGDRAVIARRQGRMVFPFEVYQGKDPMALASRVAYLIRSWKPHYVFVDGGRGEAVWSRLYQLGHQDRVHTIYFNGKTYDELCFRKRDEMWNRAKNYIGNPLPPSLPNDKDFISELTGPFFKINDRGLLEVESKSQLKSRGYRSTDLADAFILTFAEEVDETDPLTTIMEEHGFTRGTAERFMDMALHTVETPIKAYDPLAYMTEKSYGFVP